MMIEFNNPPPNYATASLLLSGAIQTVCLAARAAEYLIEQCFFFL